MESLDVALVSLIFIGVGNWMRKESFFDKYCYTLIIPAAVNRIYFLRMEFLLNWRQDLIRWGFLALSKLLREALLLFQLPTPEQKQDNDCVELIDVIRYFLDTLS